MSDGIGNRREQGSRPIWLVSVAGLEAWQSQLPETAAAWPHKLAAGPTLAFGLTKRAMQPSR